MVKTMSDTEIMNEIVKLEHQIARALSLSSNVETEITLACRERIEFLKDKLKAVA